MNRAISQAVAPVCLMIAAAGCARAPLSPAALKPTAYGAAIVESSGGKQLAAAGMTLAQPVVVQVNDDQGNGVASALVEFSGPAGVTFDPWAVLTDSSGQATTNVKLGEQGGRYRISARTLKKDQKNVDVTLEETALDYQQVLGRQLNQQYCSRCHDPESTPERVSNHDNLEVKPHEFSDGEALNQLSDADLQAIIGRGGPALNKSPLMPPYAYTLSKSEIQALISYIRMVSDPPYHAAGTVYAQK